MKVLATGGLGFVGIHLVRALAENAHVVAADLAPMEAAQERFLDPVLSNVSARVLDVRDREAVRQVIFEEGITHIVHAAAITASQTQEAERAQEIVAVNLLGAVHVLDAALEFVGVERVLLVSSSGLYGAPAQGSPRRSQRESDRTDLSSLYTITKFSAELLAARYSRLSGKPMASMRLPSVYGPMERVRSSRPRTSTLRRLMDALVEGRAMRVSGPDVASDWTYGADIGAGVAALLHAQAWSFPLYNVSCGRAVTFRTVVEEFAALGLRATWVENPAQADVAMLPAHERAPLSITRLRRDSGFRPRYDLRSGLAAWLQLEPLNAENRQPSSE